MPGEVDRPRKTKIGTEIAHVTRDSDTTFKVKGQGHQAALLTAALTREAGAAVTVRTYWAWETTATLRPLGGARGAGAPMGRRGRGISCRHAHSLFWMRECDILGCQTYSDPSYIFSEGQDHPTPRIYSSGFSWCWLVWTGVEWYRKATESLPSTASTWKVELWMRFTDSLTSFQSRCSWPSILGLPVCWCFNSFDIHLATPLYYTASDVFSSLVLSLYHFEIIIEIIISSSARQLMSVLSRRIAQISGEAEEVSFSFQHCSMLIQCVNTILLHQSWSKFYCTDCISHCIFSCNLNSLWG